MKKPIVVDSTCLIGLERVGQLELLPKLFAPVIVPPKVQDEFGGEVDWLQVEVPANQALMRTLNLLVDEGEAQVITLALERGCRVFLDDRKARRVAKEMGLSVIGTVSLLLRAKKAALIPAVKPILEMLEANGFYLSPELKTEALRLAAEGGNADPTVF